MVCVMLGGCGGPPAPSPRMPSSDPPAPLHEDFARMRAGVSYVYLGEPQRFADHVRVWLRDASGRQRVVDFSVGFDEGRVWSDQTCHGDVDRPPSQALTSTGSSDTAARAKALVRAHIRDHGFQERIERAVWRGRYRVVGVGELEPIEDCPEAADHCREGGFKAQIRGRFFAVDADLSRVLDQVCDGESHTDTVCDMGCEQPYAWLDTDGLGIEAFDLPQSRDQLTARLLEAAREY